jgi:general secretion pathway protein D
LRLNFRGVPLDMVLDYLSEEAGFIIVKKAEVKGKVDAWSNQPLTKDEAVELLNTVLNQNELAAVRNGRTLTIMTREEAKKRGIPVIKGGEADTIPKTDEMVTQIIPVKHANVTTLIANLQPLLDSYASMTPNESANSLILTATQADVRRMTEIINALDESISSTSTIKVFALRFADAKNWPMSLRNCSHQQLNNRATTIAAINLVVVAAIRSVAAAIHLAAAVVVVALAVDWEEGLVLAVARLAVEVVVVEAAVAVAVR